MTTESSVVREYLSSAYDGVRVVFSTYQSARVVAEGMADEPFDLGLFDEAHKTAGRQGTRFSFALTDGNLSTHARTLEEAGYIRIVKSFEGRRPHTRMRLTRRGRTQFRKYLETLRKVVEQGEETSK